MRPVRAAFPQEKPGGSEYMTPDAGQCRSRRLRSGHPRFSVARDIVLRAGALTLALGFSGVLTPFVSAQVGPQQLRKILSEEILPPQVGIFQLRQYLLHRIAPPPHPQSSGEWNSKAKILREHLRNDVVLHGWPREWVNAPPRFEDLGVVETGKGYCIRKLRYEIVPGFQSTALLYEPKNLTGKLPAVLNLNGHVGPPGKSIEYKQKRCINFAMHHILALNLEWIGLGELSQKENQHWFGAHLDLVGVNESGLFYLAMRKGLDYLYNHPNVDRNRLGITGLSGGGWQTIVLSSLDERVKFAVPVAGFSSLQSRIEARYFGDLGDVEQFPTDLFDGQDYTHLVALMAPRPTLLIYNAEDDACFRAPLVKPLLYDSIKPVFDLYGKGGDFGWHENTDPGTHNYQLDNRLQAYRFFAKNFDLPPLDPGLAVDSEIKSFEELRVGLPPENLTVLWLAVRLAGWIHRPPVPSDTAAWAVFQRKQLDNLVRYKPVQVHRAWAVANTKNKGLDTKAYLLEMTNGLSASTVWLKAITTGDSDPLTIVLNDGGMPASAREVADRVNRGEQVVAVDLAFIGDAWLHLTQGPFYGPIGPYLYAQILHGTGDRPLGLQAAQLIAISRWACTRAGVRKVRVEISGMRNQVAGLIAAALQPDLFSQVVIHEGIPSLKFVLDTPVTFQEAPELFCLDLYKEFDLDRLALIAAPVQVTTEKLILVAAKR